MPVLEALAGLPVSIDTSKAEVARRALELGAELVNDVTALRGDPEMAGVVAEADAYLCLMHMQGEPRTMQAARTTTTSSPRCRRFLEERLALRRRARASGGARSASIPASASARRRSRTSSCCAGSTSSRALGRPVLVGVSRKSSLGTVSRRSRRDTGRSLPASLGGAVAAFERGASILRVHDVRETVEALAVAAAVERGKINA